MVYLFSFSSAIAGRHSHCMEIDWVTMPSSEAVVSKKVRFSHSVRFQQVELTVFLLQRVDKLSLVSEGTVYVPLCLSMESFALRTTGKLNRILMSSVLVGLFSSIF